MEMIIKKQIGKNTYTFVVQGKTFHDVVMEAEKLAFQDVYKCGLCEKDYLYITAYETKEEGFKYVKIVCASCRGSLTFGQQKKNPEVFYLRKTEGRELDWKPYEGKGEVSKTNTTSKPEERDLPFN